MKFHRIFLALPLVAVLAGVAHVSQQKADPAGAKMAVAAQKFLGSLTDEQKKKAVYAFDHPERTNWEFVPLQDTKAKKATRKGLPLQDMTEEQRKLALAIVEAGTSATGNKQATTIMSLESILKATEKMSDMIRNPEWYFFTVFGTPGKAGKWGWRVEGHHLSINYTLDNNEVVCATPTFFGANPSTVKDGARKGERILPEVEDYARALFKSLDDKQRPTAVQNQKHGEPKSKSLRPTNISATPAGVPANKMTDKQRDMLMKLVRA
ncbi:MAG TPA: DUF3500 domain-containing protein, partial [Gemmataceae bacterium]|nr:DUF3500 domain-containing protein [Gemmataceae bacterium]